MFFFQAEDGIRDIGVTGVQTCALPICDLSAGRRVGCRTVLVLTGYGEQVQKTISDIDFQPDCISIDLYGAVGGILAEDRRSEERRVGKECRSRWSPYH